MSRVPLRERAARAVVRAYPPSWRDRYEEEFTALLADTGAGPRALLDAARGVADAWTRPAASVLPGALRLRATVSVVWWAWIALAAGTLVFGQLTEDPPFRAVDGAHPWLGSIYQTYVAAAHLSVLIVFIGAAPLIWSLWRAARRAGRRTTMALLAAPFAVPVAFLLILAAVARLVPHSRAPGVGIGATWFLVLAALGLLAGVACAVGPTLALRQVRASRTTLRLAAFAALPATATMTIATVASVAYSLTLHHADPRFVTSVSDQWLLVPYVLVMGLACVVATVSTHRGLRALRSPMAPA